MRGSSILTALVVISVWAAGAPRDGTAQITAATLSGVVKDESGGVLPGVAVTVKNLDTDVTRTVTTDPNGYFTVPGLPPGRYEVSAALVGFATAVERDLILAVAQQATVNFTLKLSTTQETITVVGAAALVDTRSAALSAVVTEATIEQLPLNGRNYIDLALLQPGVAGFYEKDSTASSNRGTKFNVNGMGFRSNSYLLDGANMRGYAGTATVSAAETTLGVETIQEFRVVTNAYSADYGRAMGGIVSLVSKSGTNQVRGSAFEFFRDSRMDARNFFDPGEPPPFRRHQFGGAVGGPLRRKRLFFFGGIERLQEDLGRTEVAFVPSDAARSGALGPINPAVRPYLELYPRPNGRDLGRGVAEFTYEFNQPTRETFGQGRIDYTASANDTLFVRYTYDGADQRVPAGLPEFGTTSISRNQFLTAEYRRIVTAALLNTARFSHSRLRFEQLPVGPSLPELAFLPDQTLIGVLSVPGLTNLGGTSTNPSTNNSFYWTFTDDLSYAKGRHLLKVGALVERLRTGKLTATNVRGTYTFPSLQRFLAGSPNRFQGVLPGAVLDRVRVNWLVGLYVQDDVRATDRLTLNLGLRYEFFTLPFEVHGLDTALRNLLTDADFTVGRPFGENPSLRNVAPRLGFAWDLTGDGRTALRGGAGLYHDTDGTYNSAFGIAAFSPPFAATTTISNPTFPRPSLVGGRVPRTPRTLDYHIKQPYAATYNLNLQRELPGAFVVTLGYAGSRGFNLVSAIEGNPAVPQILPDGTKFFPANAPRRNPNWGSIDYRTNGGRSVYHALQVMVQKRLSHRYQVQAAYTFGKALDNTQAQLFADVNNASVFPQDPYDRSRDRGRSDFDVRHIFTANFLWELPGREAHVLLGRWQLNGIVTLRSGVPFTPELGATNWSRSGNIPGRDRPDLKAGVTPRSLILGRPDRYFDPSGFELPPRGFLGNAGRNILEGPGLAMVNLAMVKAIPLALLGEAGEVQLRVEMFNVFNRANFAVPDRVVFAAATEGEAPLPTAGRITRTITSARQLQLGVKVLF